MTGGANRALAAKILVFTGFLMLVGALLVWLRIIPTADTIRLYLSGALAVAGIADMLMAVFFVKGSSDSGRI